MNQQRAPSCHPYLVSSPLWTRAPARDEKGSPYIDFMMIIPGLKTADDASIERCLAKLRHSLAGFESSVAYVDLNVRLNLLWVSARPVPGISKHIVQAIQKNLPEARVVAVDFSPSECAGSQREGWLGLLTRPFRLMAKQLRLNSPD